MKRVITPCVIVCSRSRRPPRCSRVARAISVPLVFFHVTRPSRSFYQSFSIRDIYAFISGVTKIHLRGESLSLSLPPPSLMLPISSSLSLLNRVLHAASKRRPAAGRSIGRSFDYLFRHLQRHLDASG